MSKEIGVVMLGVFVAVLPFLGFPESWRVVLFIFSGLAIVLLGLFLRGDHLRREIADHSAHAAQPPVRPATYRSNGRSRVASDLPGKKISDISSPTGTSASTPE